MYPQIIDQIASMTDARFSAARALAVQAEKDAYAAYCDAGRVRKSELSRITGHGSWISDLSPNGEQEAWRAAARRAKDMDAVRDGANWRVVASGTYQIVVSGCRHDISINSRGVDLSDCATPWVAIAKVRAAFEDACRIRPGEFYNDMARRVRAFSA